MAEMATVAAGVSLLGTAGQTYAATQSAKARAAGAEAEATSDIQSAAVQEYFSRRQSGLTQGSARATTAAAGLSLASGTPLFNDLENARQGELEALNVRRMGQVQATGKRYEASLARASVPGSILGGVTQGGSILTNLFAKKS